MNYKLLLYRYETDTTSTATVSFACLGRIMRVGCLKARQLTETARLRERREGKGGWGIVVCLLAATDGRLQGEEKKRRERRERRYGVSRVKKPRVGQGMTGMGREGREG